ncbi:ATP-binding cassette domain-containing protein [Myxococcota bacterium]|nr:ATP-binding cassette domain-containing protein [Myxococcota bacterium]
MAAVGLEQRFVGLLAERGSPTPDPLARAAAQVARLLLQHGISAPDPSQHLAAAPALIADLSGLPEDEAALLATLAFAPEHRPVSDPVDAEAFGARFGRRARERLLEQDTEQVDLARFALEQGPEAAVRLLDAMVRLAAADQRLTPTELRRLEAASEELGIDLAIYLRLLRRHAPDAAGRGEPVALEGSRLSIGRAPGSGLLLPHPQVAPHHADLLRDGDGWRVVDARSGRATVVDGRAVRSAPVSAAEELRIGPYRLRLDPDGRHLRAVDPGAPRVLSARHLTRHIGETCLLDELSFTVLAGEVVAVVGPSGAGKTTLLHAITGQAPADQGQVLLDGEPFHELLAADPALVGSVPQDDIVLPELTVEESLSFGARLRLGPQEGDQAQVERVLAELGITHIRGSRIGDAVRRGISGGQRKRVNLGQELLSRRTQVLFLDEPTSGLDPRAAQDIVRLVRQLADHGRMVFLVTHDLSPQVIAQVDHLMVLVPGGRLAWFGPPDDACRYFGVATPDAIFDRLGDRPPAEWGRAFRASPAARRFVASREVLPTLQAQEPGVEPAVAGADRAPPAAPPPAGVGPLAQLAVLVRRYARVKRRDRTGLWVLGAQPPFLALVMGIVFPEPTAPMLFMLTLSCLWFGMSAAVRELIADRPVWRRERRVGVGVLPYLGSKVLVLGLLSVLQTSLLSTALWLLFDMQAYGFPALHLAGVSALVGLCGMALGLLVSATFQSSEAAVGALPLLLIPQISLSALLVNLRDMTALSRALSHLDPLRYAFEAMLKVGDRIATPERVPGKWRSTSFTGPLYDYGFKGSAADDLGMAMPHLLGTVAGFGLIFLVGALLLTWRRTE